MSSTNVEKYFKESKIARDKGLEVVETIRIGRYVKPDSDFLKTYAKEVEVVIKNSKPTLIAIEYKENSDIYIEWPAEEYLALLETARDVAKKLRVKITNGGLEDDALIIYYLAYLATRDRVKYQEVLGMLDRNKQKFATAPEFQMARECIVNRVKELLLVYKRAKVDYLNIHWNDVSRTLLKECIDFIRKHTDLEVVSTEFVKPYGEALSKEITNEVNNLKLKCVIFYFALEGLQGETIINEKGGLSKLAQQLERFIWWHYNKVPRITSKYSNKKYGNQETTSA